MKEITCHKCCKNKHFSKVCRSVKSLVSSSTVSATLASTCSAYEELFKRATVFVLINNKEATVLVDIGRTASFTAYGYAKRHRLKMDSATGNVSMFSSSLNSLVNGLCTVEINLLGGL